MKLNSTLMSYALSAMLIGIQVHADTTYDAKSVVSTDQLNTIVSTILNVAPSGTKATNIDFTGNFTTNHEGFLTSLDVSAINFKVTTKVIGISVSSQVSMSISAVLPNLDCNNPQVTRFDSKGTNFLIDNAIKDHIQKNDVAIVRNNIIAQSGLLAFCKFKPVPSYMSYELPFEFELVTIDENES